MKKKLNLLFWHVLPKNLLSRWIGEIARQPLSKRLIPLYIKYFKIDLSPVKKETNDFQNLLDFFVREYKKEARPINQDKNILISPVDGTVSQIGEIVNGTLLQAKGHTYELDELLGGNKDDVNKFINGTFVTIYLSPRDYHRIHMPLTGKINRLTYIPGNLYPVNDVGVKLIPGLFVKNERVVIHIKALNQMEFRLIKVGATNVGSIKIKFDDTIYTNKKNSAQQSENYSPPVQLHKGDELGRFEFGSTVILLFQENTVEWMIDAKAGTKLQMGQPLGRILK